MKKEGKNMKKIVMATLLMGLVGIASAQVAVTGKVSQFVDNTKTNGAAGTTQLVTEPTSNIAVSVNERLAGGLTARATVETSLRGNTIDGDGTRLGDRQSTVGLANKFGSVDLGRNVHSHFLAITNNDVFGTLYGSIAGDVHNLRSLRFSDAVFTNVSLGKGASLAYERSMNGPGADASVVAISGRLLNVNGTVSRFEQGTEKTMVVGLNTKLAGNTIALVHSDTQGAVNSKGNTVGVARDFGRVTAKASYGETNRDVKAYALGADYNFSKRTAVTVAYRNVDAATDIKSIGVGLTHRF
jgi:predicted porin